MAESVYNRRQSIALASLALSVPTIPPVRRDISIGSQYYHSGATHWNGNEMSRVAITSEKAIPITEMGFPYFDRPVFPVREIRLLGRRQRGEAMTWHNEFSETVQADRVELVYTNNSGGDPLL